MYNLILKGNDIILKGKIFFKEKKIYLSLIWFLMLRFKVFIYILVLVILLMCEYIKLKYFREY